MGTLNFCTMAYIPNGTPPSSRQTCRRDGNKPDRFDSHNAHMNIIDAGKPSVFLVRQFVHIWGTS
jgi:hypothetical protein